MTEPWKKQRASWRCKPKSRNKNVTMSLNRRVFGKRRQRHAKLYVSTWKLVGLMAVVLLMLMGCASGTVKEATKPQKPRISEALLQDCPEPIALERGDMDAMIGNHIDNMAAFSECRRLHQSLTEAVRVMLE
nr:MAG TPA: putative sulfate-binding lipoprotein SubI-binding protein, TRANSPORT PROTEIN [Bacteriophage sp.]